MTLYTDPPLPQQYWMDQVKCTSKEESLWECPYVGISNNEKCDENSFVAVECSGEVKLSLNLNGQRDVCAGVVEFSTANGIIGVCNDSWANKICQELGCGDLHYIPKPGMFKEQQSKRNVLLNCVGNETFSWQCMEWSDCRERASVICSNHTRFSLRDGSNACSGLVQEKIVKQNPWNPVQSANVKPEVICPQLNCGSTGNFTKGTNILTCSDRVKLHNFTAECFGDVSIDVNGSNYEVCYSDQDSIQSRKKMGAVVCRELGCGEIVLVEQGSKTSNGFLSNVVCQGDERSLWHCLAIHEKKTCTGTKVICSGSLDVRLSDGLGRCSGRVEVKWEGSWRPIISERNTINSDVVCQHLNCGASSKINRQLFTEGEKTLEWLRDVSCNSSAKLHECFENTGLRTPRQNEKNIEIICQQEELKFFEGKSPCKGKVRIKQFDGKTVWLSAIPEEENKKKANDTCKAMQCGTLLSFEPEQNTTDDAKVTCSGSKTEEPRVALQNSLGEKCWGMVKVCGDGKCGGVCSNTWRTDEDSKMICGNLGCGNPIQAQLPRKPPKIMLSNNCTGEVLIDKEHVCASWWDDGMSNKLCDSLNCGKALYSWTTESREKNTWHFSCTGIETSVWQCGSRKDSCKNILSVACKGYTPKGSNSSVGLILGLLGAVLGLLILFLMWRNRKRLLLALRYYRNKKGKDVNPDVNEMDKMDTEDKGFSEEKASFSDNDDYQDVDSLMDKSGEEDEDDRKRDSSGTEYDDIEGQANGISPSQTHHDEDLDIPLLPKRPENIFDQDTYEVETEKQEDYDDVIPVNAAANENAGMTGTRAHVDVDMDEGADSDLDAGLFAKADTDMLTTEVEVHAQAE
ncbi:scavenger receptor cysteine-rich type 1 protein M130-like [Carassius carassius]|uniref:scavenger receptor cysteine-rich type 1 protein M130-like n=1 Tax=Carassius carassius TaxID=217509 RepID=UPI002868992F|nr:scavenger receptor cysteine-rich type 1 protein M130-like [Carassius carassius]